VEQIYNGRESGSAEAVYDLHSFLLNAYHLRDWLGDERVLVNEGSILPRSGGST